VAHAIAEIIRDLQRTEDHERRRRLRPYRERLETATLAQLRATEAEVAEELRALDGKIAECFQLRAEALLSECERHFGTPFSPGLVEGADPDESWRNELRPCRGEQRAHGEMFGQMISSATTGASIHSVARVAFSAAGRSASDTAWTAKHAGSATTFLRASSVAGPVGLAAAAGTLALGIRRTRRRAAQVEAVQVLERASIVAQERILDKHLSRTVDLHSNLLEIIRSRAAA
jgi:hypothetical protein